MPEIGTVVNLAAFEALQSSAFEYAVKQAMHKLVLELHTVEAMATRTIYALPFIVPVAMFVIQQVEKVFLVQAK